MGDVRSDLRSYYEEEARLRLRQPPKGRRVEVREEFLSLLKREGRHSVLDFGAGPGGDGRAFIEAGHRFVGIDLAHGNGALAADAGVTVVQASVAAPPVRARSFDAGWSWSTLMHIPEYDVADTLRAMAVPLRLGAPLFVGLWGGDRRDMISDWGIKGQRRPFSLRPSAVNQELLAVCGPVETVSTWDTGPAGWEYQLFQVRIET